MKILLIEDEVKLAEYLRKGLGEVGYVVDGVGVDPLPWTCIGLILKPLIFTLPDSAG